MRILSNAGLRIIFFSNAESLLDDISRKHMLWHNKTRENKFLGDRG